jgi:hypothetical protein
MEAPYSDLQVAPVQHSDYSGLQLPDYSGLQHYKPKTNGADLPDPEQKAPPETSFPKRIICGLAARNFWILALIIAIIVIGAAVGGGVGGSLASKRSKTASSLASSSSTAPVQSGSTSASPATASPTSTSHSTGPITSTTNTPSLTTTEVPEPTTTLLRDCPSSNNTLYSVDIGSVMTFRKICNLSYQNSLNTFAVVDAPTSSLDDCINLCAAYNVQNKTEIAAGESNVCNAVCWRNTFVNDDFPGQCFGYTTQNSSNAFIVNPEAKCDSAAWINQVI